MTFFVYILKLHFKPKHSSKEKTVYTGITSRVSLVNARRDSKKAYTSLCWTCPWHIVCARGPFLCRLLARCTRARRIYFELVIKSFIAFLECALYGCVTAGNIRNLTTWEFVAKYYMPVLLLPCNRILHHSTYPGRGPIPLTVNVNGLLLALTGLLCICRFMLQWWWPPSLLGRTSRRPVVGNIQKDE